MIGTIEALGVFVTAVVPGFVALRAYGYGKPPLRPRGTLGELSATLVVSAVAWTVLYLWRGRELLPVVLGEGRPSMSERLDAFGEVALLSIAVGLVLGVAFRGLGALVRGRVVRRLGPARERARGPRAAWARAKARVLREARLRTLPNFAWDRLMTRLANRGEAVVCRVRTRDGAEVLGVFAGTGFVDWEADGRGLLLDQEVVRDERGRLTQIEASGGVYVAGDQIAVLSVLRLPSEALGSAEAHE